MLPPFWAIAASPAASIGAGVVCLLVLCRHGYHRDKNGAIFRRRLASLVILSASTYTFFVLAASQLLLGSPSVSTLVRDGFGDQRVAWLLLGVILDGIFRIWDEFRHL